MRGWTKRRLVYRGAAAAALLVLAGLAAAGLNVYGTAFLRSPERQIVLAQAEDDRSTALAEASDNLSFHDRPQPVPDLRFVDGDGRAMALADFRGRVILLNVWATWCVPCRKEMPALDRLQAMLGGPGFQVIPLSIDRKGAAVVKPFYRDLGLKALSIYIDGTGTATHALKAIGVPTSVLIDPEGREIARKMGAAEWDSPAMIKAIRRHLERPARAVLMPAGALPAR